MRRTAVSACLLLAATVALVQQLPAAAPAMPAGGCAASTVRYTPVKHPVFHDEPWLLAAPTAPGVFAHLVTYVPTLREDRVNGSAGAVLWRRGEQIVWSGGAGETAELLARRLDGRGSFGLTLARDAAAYGFPSAPVFPTTGCWRLTFRAGPSSASVVVRVVERPARLGCDATRVRASGLTPVTPASSGIGAGWSWRTGNGRALVYTHGRTPGGGNTKVPWWVRTGWGRSISLWGRRLDAPGEFRQTFPMALSPEGVFPSIVDVPAAGCWLLTVRTGALAGILVARVVAAPPADIGEVIRALRTVGLPMREGRSVKQPFFTPRARVFANPGGDVRLWEFRDAKRALAAARQVDRDGSSIRHGSAVTMVEWIAPPHWFRLGRVVALYLGGDEAALAALRRVLGPQFAGR